MSITHVWTTAVKVPGLSTLPADPPITITGDYGVEVEATVNPGQILEVDVGTIVVAQIASLVLHTDQVNVTVKTNSTVTPGNTFNLGSAKALGWNNTLNYANPVTTAISKFFIDNSGGAKATIFRAGFLMNA